MVLVLWSRGTKNMDFLTLFTLLLLLFIHTALSSTQYHDGNILLTHRKIFPKQEAITSYAVIFDAGSTGSRVHVFHFDQNLDLLRIGNELEFYDKVTPGLSAYADNPQQAAESLIPLLEEAESVVPEDLYPTTPVKLGATAGLRLLEGDASERILQAVRDLLKNRSTLNTQPDAVAIIDGTQEGSYLWVTINYLLGKLGKRFSKTVGVVDLGGGSVQMAYAISRNTAKNAPKPPDGEEPYIKKLVLKGKEYDLYVHSHIKEIGIIDLNKPNSKIHPVDLEIEAKRACETKLEDAKSTYPNLAEDRLPYVCLDIAYQYALYTDGFGLDPWQEITVANEIEYQDALVEAAWPLGTAIEAISSLPKFDRLMYFI
ncbi:hypothetical protein JHK85_044971 [Glycine max]|nr:hypothetical protein JHK85_044971 [Glycine max]